MATVHFRTDDDTKRKAQKILKKIGLDLSSALNLYLHQIVINDSIPIPMCAHPVCQSGILPKGMEEELHQEAEEALREGRFFNSAEELHRDIMEHPEE